MGPVSRVCMRLLLGLMFACTSLPACAQSSDYSSDVRAFVTDAEHFVSLLHEGTTLGNWLDTRDPNDQWAEAEEEGCARFYTFDKLPSGVWIVWTLYFYPPAVPSPITFPDHGSRRDCVLGVVEVEGINGDEYLPGLMDSAARQMFTRRYGRATGSEDVPFWGPYSYSKAARWVSNIEIISGHSAGGSHCNDLREYQGSPGNNAFVCAHSAMVRQLDQDFMHIHRYREIEDSQFHRALAIAGASPVLTDEMQDLYRQTLQGDAQRQRSLFLEAVDRGAPRTQIDEPATWPASLMPLLQQWLIQLKTLPAEKRAAGLLAADHLLLAAESVTEVPLWPQQAKEQWPLENLNAKFTPSETEPGYLYTGSWAKQARELDPNGVVGQMAIIGSMAHKSCDGQDSDDPSRRVIIEGEKLLSNGLDSSIAAQVHFMVGDAYSDFVSFAAKGVDAHGMGDTKFQKEAALDRAKALEHYRAGLSADSISQNAQDAWRQAWRLVAGLMPDERYVCMDGGD